ncbi:MAG: hypothetical protein ACTHWH_05995 [Marinobacter sp.]
MIDYMTRQRARQAAKEYMVGAKLRRDSGQLADKSLADKFACSEWAIKRARYGLPTRALSEEDQALVRDCITDRAEIEKRLPMLTKEYLAYKHSVSHEAIDFQLELLGFVSPNAKRKEKAEIA